MASVPAKLGITTYPGIVHILFAETFLPTGILEEC